MLEITTLHMSVCLTPFTPLVSSPVDNVLVGITPELNQFVNAMDGKDAADALLHISDSQLVWTLCYSEVDKV